MGNSSHSRVPDGRRTLDPVRWRCPISRSTLSDIHWRSKCRRNDREKSRLLDRVAASSSAACTAPPFPKPQPEAGPCPAQLTLPEPAASLSLSHCPPLIGKPMAEDEETATARYIAANVSAQLLLKTIIEIICTMTDDPDNY